MKREKRKLPWNPSESYRTLEPGDLLPHPPPTLEQRIRVAAACATWARDCAMTGTSPPSGGMNEVIRAVLVMDDAAWARDIQSVADSFMLAGRPRSFDPVDPKMRFEQTAGG